MRSNGVHLTEGMDDSGGVMDGISSVVSSALSTSVWGCSMFMFAYDEHTEAIIASQVNNNSRTNSPCRE